MPLSGLQIDVDGSLALETACFTFTARMLSLAWGFSAWDKSLTRAWLSALQHIRTGGRKSQTFWKFTPCHSPRAMILRNYAFSTYLCIISLKTQHRLLTPAEALKVREVKTSPSFVPVSYYYANHMHGLSALSHSFSWPPKIHQCFR